MWSLCVSWRCGSGKRWRLQAYFLSEQVGKYSVHVRGSWPGAGEERTQVPWAPLLRTAVLSSLAGLPVKSVSARPSQKQGTGAAGDGTKDGQHRDRLRLTTSLLSLFRTLHSSTGKDKAMTFDAFRSDTLALS